MELEFLHQEQISESDIGLILIQIVRSDMDYMGQIDLIPICV